MRALLVAGLLCACGGDPKPDDSGAPRDVDLDALVATLGAPGPWARVGQRTLDVTWSEPGVATDRPITVTVWYPSSPDAVLVVDDTDAPLADGPHRVAVWSHGHRAYPTAASHLCSHLASHGWIVLSPSHTGNDNPLDDFRDTSIYVQRPWDVRKALDAVLADAELGAAADTSAGVLGMGHSFGGYTILAVAGATYDPAALAGCADGTGPMPFCSTMTPETEALFTAGFHDPRITAVIPMAPGDADLFGAGLGAVEVPTLLLSGALDGDRTPFWDGLDHPDDRWVDIAGAGHNAFTDLPRFTDPADDQPDPDDFLDDAEVWRLIDVYVGAFAAVHLGDPTYAPVLDTPITDDITLRTME